MTSSAPWIVFLRSRAQKVVARAPREERERLEGAVRDMERDPFAGDVQHLKDQPTAFRRRVGNWRIFFDADPISRLVDIRSIERRTTTTYRRR
jgi:mRNA-degrading endonuclease RelE of RelBE toxin-antitoxin system